MRMGTRRLTELALLTAAALIIFVIELRMPDIAIPGVKLGLANIITVYAVFRYRPGETAMLVAARILLGALFSPNPSTLLYSAEGHPGAVHLALQHDGRDPAQHRPNDGRCPAHADDGGAVAPAGAFALGMHRGALHGTLRADAGDASAQKAAA